MNVKQMAAMWQRKSVEEPQIIQKPIKIPEKITIIKHELNRGEQQHRKSVMAQQYAPKETAQTPTLKDVHAKENPKTPETIVLSPQKEHLQSQKVSQQPGKIDIKSLKNKFQQLHQPLLTPNFQSSFQGTFKKSVQLPKKQNIEHRVSEPVSYIVQTGEGTKLSFEQKRRLAEKMLFNSKISPSETSHEQLISESESKQKIYEIGRKNSDGSQKIQIKQQTYHYDGEDIARERQDNNESEQNYGGEQKQSDNVEKLSGISEILTLDTRKAKGKRKRNQAEDFDDM